MAKAPSLRRFGDRKVMYVCRGGCCFFRLCFAAHSAYGMWCLGASSGIGENLAKLLAERQCRLILSSRRKEVLEELKSKIIEQYGTPEKDILILPMDLEQTEALEDVVQQALMWCDNKLYFLFNNAGLGLRTWLGSWEIDNRILVVDLLAQAKLTKLVLPCFQNNREGHVIFTNSVQGRVAMSCRCAYSSAKHALLAYAEALGEELYAEYPNIHITSALPGYVRTGFAFAALGQDGNALCVNSASHVKGMAPERCAELMLRGTSKKMKECWIAKRPELNILYLKYYLPGIAYRLMPWIARKMINEAKMLNEESKNKSQ
eukprot:GHVT01064739.1.p1 GENE.GHVT01064739.1~~GHVT01064739.1.p1  ORF type:complete len:318 (+),score=10.97 GHVT01064739.1:990-1943(+)